MATSPACSFQVALDAKRSTPAACDQCTLPGGFHIPTVDALVPTISLVSGSATRHRNAQRARRSRILAGARTLIASGGMDNVKIRVLSEMADLSVQTIYNIVGNRNDIIEAAVAEHVSAMASSSRKIIAGYPNVFLALADSLWANLNANSDYCREATLGCSHLNVQLYKKIRTRATSELQRLLRCHYPRAANEQRVDLPTLAADITTLVGAIALEWAEGLLKPSHLRYRLACAYGRQVLMLTSDEECEAINEWLCSIKPGAS